MPEGRRSGVSRGRGGERAVGGDGCLRAVGGDGCLSGRWRWSISHMCSGKLGTVN